MKFRHMLQAAAVVLVFTAVLPENAAGQQPTESQPVHQRQLFTQSNDCIRCHADEEDKVWEYEDGTTKNIFVDVDKIANSVHGDQPCTSCHANVELKRKEHEERLLITVSCVECHREKWREQQQNPTPGRKRLQVVIEQIDSYMHSVHARPSDADQTRTNAGCYDCHDAHNIGALGSQQRAAHRLNNPDVCGRCHAQQRAEYLTSVHGQEVLVKDNVNAAVCSDCHTTHDIASPGEDPVKLAITQNCGGCHKDSLRTYMNSYHGQVNRLGYTNTSKCYDCHGSHQLKAVDDPTSGVHPDNRLATCRQCHEDAPEGFQSFYPHGHADDYEKYPEIWITARFMKALIIGVFLFFWTHVIFWFFREMRDRQQGKGYHPPPEGEQVYFRRFSTSWRIIHLLFAVSTMTLVLTGTSLLFAHTRWAAFVIDLLGGPQVEGIIHRTAATLWLGIFVVHLVLVTRNIYRQGKNFRWFGPTSMLPNWQDFRDLWAMMRWFVGRGPRPDFDRWSYWQKFDYWAPFWGAGVIGLSGVLLFFPTLTGMFVPGFVFNVATIVHAEEALLATMFLFTVHFFNAHFRPDKFPMSITIFTGAVPLEEFKHDHRLEYERLQASGELDRYLVKPPSQALRKGSTVLAAILILFGLTLLTMAITGYLSSPR